MAEPLLLQRNHGTSSRAGFLVSAISRSAGGISGSVRALTKTLTAERLVDVEVIACEDNYSKYDLKCWLPLKPRLHHVLGPRSFGYAPDMTRSLIDLDLDLLHTNGLWMYPSIATRKWTHYTGRPYLITPHGMLDPWALQNSRWKKTFAGLLYENTHLKGAACLHALCLSEATAIRNFGLRNPICVIPNGIDIPEQKGFAEAPWKEIIGNNRRVLLYLGRIHPKKGLGNLLSAWNVLKRNQNVYFSDWVLAITGWDQNGHERALKKQSCETGLEDSVFFLGPQFGEKKDASYHNADAFILPSLSEGLPMVVLEAWAHGLPVLMSPQCNIPAGFNIGAALKIQPEAGDIARGLNELFAMSEQERESIGLKGRELVAQQFNWSIIATKMYSVYSWILGGGSPPNCVKFD